MGCKSNYGNSMACGGTYTNNIATEASGLGCDSGSTSGSQQYPCARPDTNTNNTSGTIYIKVTPDACNDGGCGTKTSTNVKEQNYTRIFKQNVTIRKRTNTEYITGTPEHVGDYANGNTCSHSPKQSCNMCATNNRKFK